MTEEVTSIPKTPRPRSVRPRRVTLLDVAREAGLSRTTVSDVLNRGEAGRLYAEETRRRVQAAVRTLGYAPSSSAQKLARGRSGLIGLVLLRDFSNPYFARLADAVDREVRRRGMRLQTAVRTCDEQDEEHCAREDARLIEQMQADEVEGLLMGPVYERLDLRQHKHLFTGALPTVLFGSAMHHGGEGRSGLDTIGYDAIASRSLAVEHLRELGHTRVGYLCAPPNRVDPTAVDHVAGLRLLAEAGMFAGPQWVMWQPDDGVLDHYAAAAESFAEQWHTTQPSRRPTALICLNDASAMAALGVFHRRGIRVPQDVSLVGNDDLPEAAHLVPALTTISNDVTAEMRLAVGRLTARIEDPSLPAIAQAGEPRLVVRDSTAPPSLLHS
jgi:LacI family transcriptional regulator